MMEIEKAKPLSALGQTQPAKNSL